MQNTSLTRFFKEDIKGYANIPVLYCVNETPLDPSLFDSYLNLLPLHLRSEVLKYRKWSDRHNCLFGKLLLYIGYFFLTGKELDFNLIKRDSYGKPFVQGDDFDFNISHTKNTVICAFSKDKIGIDIEAKQDVDLSFFEGIFSEDELTVIKANGLSKFFEYWTKKEAFAKAVGKGFSMDFKAMHVKEDIITFKEQQWYSYCEQIDDIFCSLVLKNEKKVSFEQINFNTNFSYRVFDV